MSLYIHQWYSNTHANNRQAFIFIFHSVYFSCAFLVRVWRKLLARAHCLNVSSAVLTIPNTTNIQSECRSMSTSYARCMHIHYGAWEIENEFVHWCHLLCELFWSHLNRTLCQWNSYTHWNTCAFCLSESRNNRQSEIWNPFSISTRWLHSQQLSLRLSDNPDSWINSNRTVMTYRLSYKYAMRSITLTTCSRCQLPDANRRKSDTNFSQLFASWIQKKKNVDSNVLFSRSKYSTK